MDTTPTTETERTRIRVRVSADTLASARYVLALRGIHYAQSTYGRMRTAPAEIGR